MATEQRRFHRVPFSATAHFTANGQQWNARLLDISLKGALVAPPPDCKVLVGAQCILELHLDDAETVITMHAHVVHITSNHFGLCGDRIDTESLTHLRRLIELNLGDAELAQRELAQLRP